jgi:toxin ParE1/3/4
MADKVIFRALAETDIETIGDMIARDSERHAAAWVAELRARCESLSEMAERWPLQTSVIRRMVVGDYLVFFRIAYPDIPGRRHVIVIRILHGARRIPQSLGG